MRHLVWCGTEFILVPWSFKMTDRGSNKEMVCINFIELGSLSHSDWRLKTRQLKLEIQVSESVHCAESAWRALGNGLQKRNLQSEWDNEPSSRCLVLKLDLWIVDKKFTSTLKSLSLFFDFADRGKVGNQSMINYHAAWFMQKLT